MEVVIVKNKISQVTFVWWSRDLSYVIKRYVLALIKYTRYVKIYGIWDPTSGEIQFLVINMHTRVGWDTPELHQM